MNKDNERSVFDLVYRSHDQWLVVPGEAPDFICYRSDLPVLSVEVTELWQNGTEARLSNISGYFSSLLDGGDVRHKDDRIGTKVETIRLLPPDSLEPIEEVEALVRKHPPPAECARLLCAVLAGKESKLTSYRVKSDYVDLVIDDRSMLFYFIDFEQFMRHFTDSGIRGAVTGSGFREIFLLTRGKEEGQVRIPLKAQFLLEDLMTLEDLLIEEAPELGDHLYLSADPYPSALSVLAAAMGRLGHAKVSACVEEGCIGLSIGCLTVHWTSNGKVVRDYTCLPEQVLLTPGSLAPPSTDTDSLAGLISERRSSRQVFFPLAFPAA